ncbi:MAG: putative lipid II flippase FtsW [Pseudomonadota bacterium]
MKQTATAQLDWVLCITLLLLLSFGVVMVASSSLHIHATAPWSYLQRHSMALGLGLLLATLAYQVPVHWWDKGSIWLYSIGLILLGLIWLPDLGHEVNGARRWLALPLFRVQPAELMKLFAVLYLASYLARRQTEVESSLWGFSKPFLMLLIPCGLIALQPDFGTVAVLLFLTFALLFLAGARLRHFILPGLIAVAALAMLILAADYRIDRLVSFTDPWQYATKGGYQLVQALVAFGRGGLFGVGLGNSIQKHFHLPEAHTDFMLAVIGEELGLLGTLTIIGLFSLLLWRTFVIGRAAQARSALHAAYLAYGLGLCLGTQAFLNIGVNLGALPTKGLTLPFLSFGGNSLIVCLIASGILLRLHRENTI